MLNLIGLQPKYEDYIEVYVANIMIKKAIGKKSEFFGGFSFTGVVFANKQNRRRNWKKEYKGKCLYTVHNFEITSTRKFNLFYDFI